MAGASVSTSYYKLDIMVRGHHVYKIIWTPLLGETLKKGGNWEDDNDYDEYVVAITRRENLSENHVPREISRACYYFLGHGSMSCRIPLEVV